MIVSNNLYRSLKQKSIKPILVLEIDGVPFLIGSDKIKRYPRLGDPGLFLGMPGLFLGGMIEYPNQKTLISLEGTTTQIRQSLEPDKARGSGISQMTISLIDKNLEATKLLAGAYGEVLFKKVRLWASFGESVAWNEDFIILFRGVIESVTAGQGKCLLHLSSPDQKKRAQLYIKGDTELTNAIDDSQTSLDVVDIANFFTIPNHPAYGGPDPDIKTCLRIDDEIMTYDTIEGSTISGITRGAEGTTAAAHEEGAQVESFLVVSGNAMDIALKVMLSDKDQTPYIQEMPATFVGSNGESPAANTIFFADKMFRRNYLVRAGDYIKTEGFTNPENNLSEWTEILEVTQTDLGSFILVDADLTEELATEGTVSFLSQWNSFGAFGLGLDQDDVDIDKHIYLRNSFLSQFDLKFFIRDDIEEGKEWIEKELYLPASCYSLPTDNEGLSRSSVGIHKPPLPGTNTITVSKSNITNPKELAIQRSVNKNYYNAVVFKYEDSPLDEELRRRVITVVGTQDIPTGNKTLLIESYGLRNIFAARALAEASANRFLLRYRSAAEFLNGAKVHFRDAIQIVVGDVVIFDPRDLNMIDNTTASRNKEPLLMEVVNRDVDIKNGSVRLDLVATGFNINARFGLISPASRIVGALDSKRFVITYLYAPSTFGASEYRKWERLTEPRVVIRSPDFSQEFQTTIVNASSNTIEVSDEIPFDPTDCVLEFAKYSNCTIEQKLLYAFLTDADNNFPDDGPPYVFI